jgi:predicted metal-dependent peptidase
MLSKLSTTLKRIISLRADICWQLPYLASATGALVWHEDTRISTACVDARGRAWVSPEFFAAQPNDVARFVMLHEAFHPMLQHQNRRGSRDPRVWNYAADLSINSALEHVKPGYITVPPWALLPARILPGAPAFASAEEYYARLTQDAEARKRCGEGGEDGGEPMPGAGCGTREDTEGEAAPGDLTPAQWRMIGHTVQSQAASSGGAGSAALGALANLLNIPPPRVKWGALLRDAASHAAIQAGRDDVSWQRRGRRSNAAYTLPGGITTKAQIAVVIDSSGSVGDDALARAVAETCAAVDATNVPAYLVIHDAAVQWEGWLRPGVRSRQVAGYIRGRGGTRFTPAYNAIAALRAKFGALVHFTDGLPCEKWPELPGNCRRGIAALIGAASTAHIPERRWRAVECDL